MLVMIGNIGKYLCGLKQKLSKMGVLSEKDACAHGGKVLGITAQHSETLKRVMIRSKPRKSFLPGE